MGEKTIYNLFEELAEIIADAAPTRIMELKADRRTQLRNERLVQKLKDGVISKKEKDELDQFMVLERFVSWQK